MSQQIETRSEKFVICATCRGTGVRTVMVHGPLDQKPSLGGFHWSTTVGAQIPTKLVICDRCGGQRLLKRIKATTYERVSAPEPTP
jgi:DNA-directed RNA polymerase subunit RPC12/RpoP